MTRRNLELALLVIGAPVVILLFAMLALNQGESISVNSLGVPLGIFGAFLVSHLAVRRFAPEADPAILPIVFVLAGIGICFVTRLAPDLAVNQVAWLFVGVGAMVGVLALSRNIEQRDDPHDQHGKEGAQVGHMQRPHLHGEHREHLAVGGEVPR